MGQLCWHGSTLPHGSLQFGMASWHDILGCEPGIFDNGVFPQEQYDTVSGEYGQCGTPISWEWQVFWQECTPQSYNRLHTVPHAKDPVHTSISTPDVGLSL